MSSQYFTGARLLLLIVQDGLRRRFARFKLCAHFLDLRCLLFHGCDETRHRSASNCSVPLLVFFEELV